MTTETNTAATTPPATGDAEDRFARGARRLAMPVVPEESFLTAVDALVEDLPVVVRATETTRGRGRLYRRAGDRDRPEQPCEQEEPVRRHP